MTKRILVLDAAQRSSLAVVRSLGRRADTEVFTADNGRSALAGLSKYSRRYHSHPSAAESPRQFVQWLADTIERERIDVVVPVTEISGQLVQMHREQLPACIVPLPDIDTLLSLGDKGSLVELAREHGIPVPETTHYNNGRELQLRESQQFPLVLKPCRSHIWLGDRWLSTAVAIARDADELARLLRDKPWFAQHPFLAQSFIPGSGAGVFALCEGGEPLALFAHRRLREKPPAGGVSVFCESAAVDPALAGHARKLLAAATWTGVAMVEFRVTPEGEPWLMEVNTRFWGSLQLAIDAGIDFPSLLLDLYTGNRPAPPGEYRTGRRLRWLLGDLDHLWLRLKGDEPIAAKLGAIGTFLKPNRRTRHEVDRLEDPGPAWFELKDWFGG